MKPPKRNGASCLILLLLFASNAHALDESTRRPFYVQGVLGGGAVWTGFSFGPGAEAYWHPDIEVGLHFTGRHDGPVIGLRQAFNVGRSIGGGSTSIGETELRGGYDIAIPFRNGRFEITLAPYGTLGVDYFFTNLVTGFRWSVGAEAKLFFFHGMFLLVRPFELSGGEFVPLGRMFFNFNAGAGVGLAF
jgi:hypothetical protein